MSLYFSKGRKMHKNLNLQKSTIHNDLKADTMLKLDDKQKQIF